MQHRAAAEIFHRDVVVVAGAADVMDADDVAVVQLRGDLRFAQEALAEIRIGEQRRRHDLQRDLAVDRFLHRQIDRRHAATAELAQQTVAGDVDHVRVIFAAGHRVPPDRRGRAETQNIMQDAVQRVERDSLRRRSLWPKRALRIWQFCGSQCQAFPIRRMRSVFPSRAKPNPTSRHAARLDHVRHREQLRQQSLN